MRDHCEDSREPGVQTADWRQIDTELCEGFITSLHQIGDRYGGHYTPIKDQRLVVNSLKERAKNRSTLKQLFLKSIKVTT